MNILKVNCKILTRLTNIYIDGPYTATIYVGEFFFEFSTYKLIFHTASREPMSNSAVLNIRTDINQVCLISSEDNP